MITVTGGTVRVGGSGIRSFTTKAQTPVPLADPEEFEALREVLQPARGVAEMHERLAGTTGRQKSAGEGGTP
jgi:hypothetical protein